MHTAQTSSKTTSGTCSIHLATKQTNDLYAAVSEIAPPTPGNYRDFYRQAKAACGKILSSEQKGWLASIGSSARSAALVIYGVPVHFDGELDPSSGQRPDGLPWAIDAVHIGIVAHAGYPLGYPDEYDGAKIHEIAPANANISKPKKSQQRTALAVHSDRARFPDIAQCDVLTLLGLRNPDNVATQFASVTDVLERVPETLRAPLFEARFDFSKDERFSDFRPILRIVDGELVVCLPPEDLPCDSEAKVAQDEFRAAVVDGGVVLQRGMMLLMRNRNCLHWRSAIDSPTRWLRRAYCISPNKYEALAAHGLIDPDTFVLSVS